MYVPVLLPVTAAPVPAGAEPAAPVPEAVGRVRYKVEVRYSVEVEWMVVVTTVAEEP